MVSPQRQSAVLGPELDGLTRDDRTRLEQILWRLQAEQRRSSQDDDSLWAYIHALSLAGRGPEARALLDRHVRIPPGALESLTPDVVNALNFTASLGYATQSLGLAHRVLELFESEDPSVLGSTLAAAALHNAASAGLHFGDLELVRACVTHRQRLGEARYADTLEVLDALGLAAYWARQQEALRPLLGPVTTCFYDGLLEDPDEGSTRIVLSYFTEEDTDLERLEMEVADALERVYADHPEGPGYNLGKVVVSIDGPYIPRIEP